MAQLPSQSAEAVAEAARTLFADDGWVDRLIDSLAAPMRADPFFDPPFRAINSDIHSGLIVFEDEHMSVAAGVTRVAELAAKKNAKRGATSVGFTGRVSVLKFVKAGGARISFWEAPPITAAFTRGRGRAMRAHRRARSSRTARSSSIDGRLPELRDRAGAREPRRPPGGDRARRGAAQRRI